MVRRRNTRGEGDRLRDDLLDAAEGLLAELDDERQLTIRAIVERVGVTPPSLYRHFPTKEALVAAVVARRFMALGMATNAAAAVPVERGDAAGALRAGCLAYLEWAVENPGGYAVLFRTRRDTEIGGTEIDTSSVAFDSLVAGIEGCQAAGQAREGDARAMAALTWAALHGIATLTTLRRRFPWPTIEAMVDDLLGSVVGVPSPPPRDPPGGPVPPLRQGSPGAQSGHGQAAAVMPPSGSSG